MIAARRCTFTRQQTHNHPCQTAIIMLDSNALQQLSQLKQTIRADKNLYPGTVKGSQGRFGFVTLDDGREGFLAPAEMARVLPGDRVEVSVKEKTANSGNDKIEVELDKLLSSSLQKLAGHYVVRGKGHFLAVDMPQMNRWIFLPPKARGKAQEGDFLLCKLTRHPFEDGKGQARVLEVIGRPSETGIEHKFTCLKYNLPRHWSSAALKQSADISALPLEKIPDYSSRRNFEHLGFITIDSATTTDMDDALHVKATADGWELSVAIADPTAVIDTASALDVAAAKRANTVYLPGQPLTMLPETLANDTFSLTAGKLRPALLCQMLIGTDGSIHRYHFEFGLVRSQHKLSYETVSRFLQGDIDACPADSHELLRQLAACSRALNQYRGLHMLLMDERDDHEIQVNEQMHIAAIHRQRRTKAHQIVEESMLATNRSAGDFFSSNLPSGIFSAHNGFRAEKLAGIKSVLSADLPQQAALDPATAEGYRQLIQALQADAGAANLLAALRLMLQAGRLTTEPDPHLGLGMSHYATVTSPIRRYNDFCNHRALRAVLDQQPVKLPSAEELAELQQRIGTTRAANRDLEQWLYCLFLQQHKDKTLTGQVFRVNSQGVVVKLDDWGITGFVKIDPKAYKFDELRLTLTGETETLHLNLAMQVRVDRIDLDKKRINLSRVDTATS